MPFGPPGWTTTPPWPTFRSRCSKAPGAHVPAVSSDRAINDPFIDLILEANWSAGRIVRDYTMLFDPPSLRPASATAPVP
jgi:pilus assembly protein FimV